MCKQPDKATSAGATGSTTGSRDTMPHHKKTDGDMTPTTFTDSQAQELAPTHSDHKRNTQYDWLIFLGPLLFYKLTPVYAIYAIAITRILSTHLILSLHYQFVDKDNYLNKLTQKQIAREKDEYMTAFLMHMYVQVALQFIFPSMFFSSAVTSLATIPWDCIVEAFIGHVVLVEPIYYLVHRWLHLPRNMKSMHGFHHLSISTLPTTSLCQNWKEHIVYIATFGPAFLVPFLLKGRQHWIAIGAYLVGFDIVNAFGHTNLKLSDKWYCKFWTSKYSPLHYLFYTPEFHLGHHAYFNANFTLFMPIWDYLGGTAREYTIKDRGLKPSKQQDFVFIGHNGGLGHLLTVPELCLYNVYDEYSLTPLPIAIEMLLMNVIGMITRLFQTFYYCTRFCIANQYIGRIIVLVRTPYDYMTPKQYPTVNADIIKCMKQQHKRKGTRYFGLGNLNKMKQLNNGGIDIAHMVSEDSYLKDKNIRVWTGDTMTVASLVHQVLDIPDLGNELYYIGAGGKVGTAVCELLVEARPNLKIRIFSRHAVLKHPNLTYSTDLSEMCNYRYVLVGKILGDKMYRTAFKGQEPGKVQTRFVLDYTVPALLIPTFQSRPEDIRHVRVGLLKTHSNNPFLKGHYDLCMSTDENHIVPCHFGCILQTVMNFEHNEVGEIDQSRVKEMWKMTTSLGFENVSIF